MKNYVNRLKQAGFAVAVMAPGIAAAELPAGVAAGISELQADGLALADMVWPALLALLGAGVLMKIAKRFFNKI